MIRLIVFLLIPLIVFLVSNPAKQKSNIKTAKQQTQQDLDSQVNSTFEQVPVTATTQLDLFVNDEDFDINDLISADRRSK